MVIGIPKEIKKDEFRVGMTPNGVHELIQKGCSVIVEKGAGEGSGFSDESYQDAGAMVFMNPSDVFASADMIVKVKEPIEAEYPLLREGQMLFTYLHLAADRRLTELLCEKKITAFAYETLNIGKRLPLLEPMSEIAGKMATLFGSVHLGRYYGGSGRLLGGTAITEKNRVLVLGGGVAGKAAAMAAAGLGSEVIIMDINSERLEYLRDVLPSNVTTLYSSKELIDKYLKDADLVIGTVLLPGAKAPKLITREMLSMMKSGSVLVDVSIDQGGCFESSHPTTHSSPTFEVDGIIHYCVANMPGMYPRTSTIALTTATLPFVLDLATNPLESVLKQEHFQNALNTYQGNLTNQAVSIAHDMIFKPLGEI